MSILIFASGYSLWQWLGPKPNGSAAAGGPMGGKMQGPPPRPVITTTLKPSGGSQTINVTGQVEASDSTTLRSQVSGTVQALRVKEGDRVGRGEVIAVLDSTDQQLALAQAKARLEEAKRDLAELKQGTRTEVIAQRRAAVSAANARETDARDNLRRIQGLVKQGALADRALIEAQASIDTAVSHRLAAAASLAEAEAGPRADEIAAEQAKVEAQQAAVNQASVAADRARIIATSSGIVNKRTVNVGDYVRSADPVLELVDNTSVDVLLQIPENLASQVQPGLSVKLTSRAIPGWSRTATVDALMPTTSSSSRRRPARIRLSNPPAGLLPGTRSAPVSP
ncbi:MAG: HlyD family efflux transporter periplasmic adaptor subunit [Alkalinema sp. RL_2_19]|nr:HlyD family efflux transporter periplasmic adaptor subunit [Alkalinema sp. RL_2_19]